MGLVTHARCAYIFIIVHSCWFVSEEVSLASALNAFESKLAMQHIHIWHRKQTKLSPPTYRSLTSLILKHTTSQLTVGRATLLSNSTVLAPSSFYNTSFHLLSSHYSLSFCLPWPPTPWLVAWLLVLTPEMKSMFCMVTRYLLLFISPKTLFRDEVTLKSFKLLGNNVIIHFHMAATASNSSVCFKSLSSLWWRDWIQGRWYVVCGMSCVWIPGLSSLLWLWKKWREPVLSSV